MTIQELMRAIDTEEVETIPFEMKETNDKLFDLCKNLDVEQEGILLDIIMEERENAFRVGYQTAFPLILEGVGWRSGGSSI